MRTWVELSSAERLDAILLAVHAIERSRGDATAGAIANHIGREHPMESPNYSRRGRGRQVSTATRVTPGITVLRKRGLLQYRERMSGVSGGCDALTAAGSARVRDLRATG